MDISHLDDEQLLLRTEAIAADMRRSSACLVEHLAELDRRELALERGYGSLYEYALIRLRLTEGAAYRHIRAARAIRAVPALLEMLRDGRLSLDAIVLLHPYLQDADAAVLIKKAVGLRSRQLEAMLARRRTEPPLKDVIRYMGQPPAPAAVPGVQAGLALGHVTMEALGSGDLPGGTPKRNDDAAAGGTVPRTEAPLPADTPRPVRVAFTADEDFLAMVRRARELLRHKYPDGRLEGVLRDALKALLAKKDPFVRWAGKPPARRTYPRRPQPD